VRGPQRRFRLIAAAVVAVGVAASLVLMLTRHPPAQRRAVPPLPAAASRTLQSAPAQQTSGVAVYSDLCVHAGSQDVDGLRIFVRSDGREPHVLGQYAADGRLPPPAPAQSSEQSGRVTFRLAGVSGASFIGVVEHGRATVRSTAPRAEPFDLPPGDASDDFPLCG
jgi:hypothetical protein